MEYNFEQDNEYTMVNSKSYSKISLTSFVMPNTYDTIISGANGFFGLVVDSMPMFVVLDVGQYTLATMMAAVEAAIVADTRIDGTYAVTEADGYVSITRTDAASDIRIAVGEGDVGYRLGWRVDNDDVDTTSTASARFMISPTTLELRISGPVFNESFSVRDDYNLIKSVYWPIRIPVTAMSEEMILFTPPSANSFTVSLSQPVAVNSLKVSLHDPSSGMARLDNKGLAAIVQLHMT